MATDYKAFYDYGEDDRPSLSINERIVWISDNGPEYGYVRWLGKLPDLGKEWMAGVEFDNPVGSGTGLYKDKQLFVTSLNHASLVPVIGLLKASDFCGPTDTPTKSPPRLMTFHDEPLRRYEHDNLDDLYSQFSSVDSIYRGRLSDRRPEGRVRQIPITLEDESSVRPDGPKVPTNALSNTYQKHEHQSFINSKPMKHTNNEFSTSDPIRNLTSSLKQVSLDSDRLQRRTSSLVPLLPQPALVVSSTDNNPSSTLKDLLGKSRGIQGHNNSCYLDATLFAMFSSTTTFDSLLYRPPNQNDIPEYNEIQRILREDIVRRLREQYIVNADQVMVFRTKLEQSSSVEGLTDEEKDPEEFLSLLLNQILKAEPYLKLSSGLESFLYQLIVEKNESVVLPTVQDLFDQSFVDSTVRLSEIPPCLLLQMPRFGRQYKMYSRIMPSLVLDITDVLEAVPRSCGHRGKDCDNIARYECKQCLNEQSGRDCARLSSITYCNNCFQSKHFSKSHMTGIEDHDRTKTALNLTPTEAIQRYSNKSSSSKNKTIPRIEMELFAVLCIETSHYVCFVKCGQGTDAPWCFFDSMADRRGEQDGYNIPEVSLFEDFNYWTSESGAAYLLNNKDDKSLPEMARRLICDAYLCFYRFNGLATYR